jgi:hypothetical protein
MPESDQFALLRKKLGIKELKELKSLQNHTDYIYLALLFYPLITIFLLIYTKPDFICEKKLFDDIDLEYSGVGVRQFYRQRKISYSKLIAAFLILQTPLVLYYVFRKGKEEKDDE